MHQCPSSPPAEAKLPLSVPQAPGRGADRSRATSYPGHTSGCSSLAIYAENPSSEPGSVHLLTLSQKHHWEKVGDRRARRRVRSEVQTPALPLGSWALLDTLPHFSVPQFPLLPNRVNSNAARRKETMGMVRLAHGEHSETVSSENCGCC